MTFSIEISYIDNATRMMMIDDSYVIQTQLSTLLTDKKHKFISLFLRRWSIL